VNQKFLSKQNISLGFRIFQILFLMYFFKFISNANRLVMRNSIVLNDLFESSYCAIVFQVEYIINIPIQRDLISTVKNKVKLNIQFK